jgi:hypothetical protein
MTCAGFDPTISTGIAGFLSYPTICDHHFWAKILAGFFIILTFILFNRDKERLVKADMLSSMGVSALATIFIAVLGTLLGIISSDVFLEIFVTGLIFIAIWIFKE